MVRLREEGRSAVAGSAWRRIREALRNPWVRRTLPVLAAVGVGVLAGIAVAAAIRIPEVDSLEEFNPSRITRVYDRGGNVFAEFARERRTLLDETEVPDLLIHAIVALEDAKFFQHGGVDFAGAVRAALTNWRLGRREEGASTITMQLARTLFYTRDKTWSRKIEEALTAVELEKRYSKQQLLTLYCNLINFGHGNYGVAQAARFYFGKRVDELELHEAAMIAGIPQRPSDYSPYRRPDLVKRRRDHVLRRMLSEGYIDQAAYEAALAMPLGVIPQRKEKPFAPYFSEEVRQKIESTYGTSAMLESGLQVYTTLDPLIQSAAEEGLHYGLLKLDHRKGWRGPLRHVSGDLEEATLESWRPDPLEPETWYEGLVLETSAEEARVRIGEQVFELGSSGMKWTRKTPRGALKSGDVAWFRFEADEEGGLGELMLEQEPRVEGAAIVLESATGAIRALIGGWDFDRSKFDRALQAKRQVGSAFKTFVWGTALEAGYTAADT
ncbi:MAG: transglycosylase domain-containing protein, partial [Acidobacteria bacterium]|nr:transglycosylase domain-containing protein [Acidobacteriota bacterium]